MNEPSDVMRFTNAARIIANLAREHELECPAFRSPPSEPEVNRSIRRYEGGFVVAVRLRGRPLEDSVVDMIDGMLEGNGRADDWPLRRELIFTLMEAELVGG